VFRWISRVLVLLLLVIGGGWFGANRLLSKPYLGFQGEKLLEIDRGSGTRQIAKQLAEAGVIESEWYFLAARAMRPRTSLQAGEYQFQKPASVWEVYNRLGRGDIYSFDFTVPEGSNIWDIARLLELQHIMPESDFLRAASDPSLVRDIAPEAESLEGYLFPATYRLTHKTTARELCRMMVDQFKKQWKALGGESAPHPTVTLASLVEEETGVPSERAIVAGVFKNRLQKGMTLACDPTVVYAALLEGKYRGTIYKSDLERKNPYNTYLNRGLPPGPITNPGKASIDAAMHPADTDALYFVARADGPGHVFSATGAAHLRAVQNYRAGIAGAKTN
jgi:UPF0755 protein